MNPIDLLLRILNSREQRNRITHITLSPWLWLMFNARVSERWVVWSGFESEEMGPPSIDDGVTISLRWDQEEDLRLWDRKGREVFRSVELVIGSVRGDC
jgi:hypothetical protein